eukprot:m51a1_g12285 hypothetical protein (1571) ;mRNA; f:267449-279802
MEQEGATADVEQSGDAFDSWDEESESAPAVIPETDEQRESAPAEASEDESQPPYHESAEDESALGHAEEKVEPSPTGNELGAPSEHDAQQLGVEDVEPPAPGDHEEATSEPAHPAESAEDGEEQSPSIESLEEIGHAEEVEAKPSPADNEFAGEAVSDHDVQQRDMEDVEPPAPEDNEEETSMPENPAESAEDNEQMVVVCEPATMVDQQVESTGQVAERSEEYQALPETEDDIADAVPPPSLPAPEKAAASPTVSVLDDDELLEAADTAVNRSAELLRDVAGVIEAGSVADSLNSSVSLDDDDLLGRASAAIRTSEEPVQAVSEEPDLSLDIQEPEGHHESPKSQKAVSFDDGLSLDSAGDAAESAQESLAVPSKNLMASSLGVDLDTTVDLLEEAAQPAAAAAEEASILSLEEEQADSKAAANSAELADSDQAKTESADEALSLSDAVPSSPPIAEQKGDVLDMTLSLLESAAEEHAAVGTTGIEEELEEETFDDDDARPLAPVDKRDERTIPVNVEEPEHHYAEQGDSLEELSEDEDAAKPVAASAQKRVSFDDSLSLSFEEVPQPETPPSKSLVVSSLGAELDTTIELPEERVHEPLEEKVGRADEPVQSALHDEVAVDNDDSEKEDSFDESLEGSGGEQQGSLAVPSKNLMASSLGADLDTSITDLLEETAQPPEVGRAGEKPAPEGEASLLSIEEEQAEQKTSTWNSKHSKLWSMWTPSSDFEGAESEEEAGSEPPAVQSQTEELQEGSGSGDQGTPEHKADHEEREAQPEDLVAEATQKPAERPLAEGSTLDLSFDDGAEVQSAEKTQKDLLASSLDENDAAADDATAVSSKPEARESEQDSLDVSLGLDGDKPTSAPVQTGDSQQADALDITTDLSESDAPKEEALQRVEVLSDTKSREEPISEGDSLLSLDVEDRESSSKPAQRVDSGELGLSLDIEEPEGQRESAKPPAAESLDDGLSLDSAGDAAETAQGSLAVPTKNLMASSLGADLDTTVDLLEDAAQPPEAGRSDEKPATEEDASLHSIEEERATEELSEAPGESELSVPKVTVTEPVEEEPRVSVSEEKPAAPIPVSHKPVALEMELEPSSLVANEAATAQLEEAPAQEDFATESPAVKRVAAVEVQAPYTPAESEPEELTIDLLEEEEQKPKESPLAEGTTLDLSLDGQAEAQPAKKQDLLASSLGDLDTTSDGAAAVPAQAAAQQSAGLDSLDMTLDVGGDEESPAPGVPQGGKDELDMTMGLEASALQSEADTELKPESSAMVETESVADVQPSSSIQASAERPQEEEQDLEGPQAAVNTVVDERSSSEGEEGEEDLEDEDLAEEPVVVVPTASPPAPATGGAPEGEEEEEVEEELLEDESATEEPSMDAQENGGMQAAGNVPPTAAAAPSDDALEEEDLLEEDEEELESKPQPPAKQPALAAVVEESFGLSLELSDDGGRHAPKKAPTTAPAALKPSAAADDSLDLSLELDEDSAAAKLKANESTLSLDLSIDGPAPKKAPSRAKGAAPDDLLELSMDSRDESSKGDVDLSLSIDEEAPKQKKAPAPAPSDDLLDDLELLP